MLGPALGRSVVVPVANPASVGPLLRLGARLASADQGSVEIITVLPASTPADEQAYAWQGLADAEHIGNELDARIRGHVIEATDVATGVLEALERYDASLVLMGWRGVSSTSDVFGRLIDRIVGRSTVPLGILRLGTVEARRVLLPVSSDHLLPGGASGLALAAAFVERLRRGLPEPTTVLRTGAREGELPSDIARLSDRVHHDPRRTHHAVGAFARPDDLIVAPVAPTASGLRGATTHLAWAAPDATLLVAIDGGTPRERDLVEAVGNAGRPTPVDEQVDEPVRMVRIMVTVRLPEDGDIAPEVLEQVLGQAGETDHLMAWWPAADTHPHVRATVSVRAANANQAIAGVMTVVHDSPLLEGAEITYDVERAIPSPPRWARPRSTRVRQ